MATNIELVAQYAQLPGCSLADWQQVARHCCVDGAIPVKFSAYLDVGYYNAVSLLAEATVQDIDTGNPRVIRHVSYPWNTLECASPGAFFRMAKVLYDHECAERFKLSDQTRPFNPHRVGTIQGAYEQQYREKQ